eukprot:4233020-Amphidinium_carterae.1
MRDSQNLSVAHDSKVIMLRCSSVLDSKERLTSEVKPSLACCRGAKYIRNPRLQDSSDARIGV